uniref:Uncharacterized protein n=1 Tax=Acrobeloides nanus TaxID=290746 RepID=A0A914DGH7_9BILA
MYILRAPKELISEKYENIRSKLSSNARRSLLKSETDEDLEKLITSLKKDYTDITLRWFNPTCFFSALPCFSKKGYFYVPRQRKDYD